MKQRFSSLDVRVIAHELSSSLVSLRLSNVYDLSSRIFLLKFAKPNAREQLIVDSGFRCHLTSFARSTAAAPSPFVARLRKYLRTRRVTQVSQIGTDRVIELQFSDGAYRLFLEFYAGGNIILTDADLNITALLRNVTEGAEEEHFRVGQKYDLSVRQNFAGVPDLTRERIKDGLQKAVEKQQAEAAKPGKKIKKRAGDTLRKALAVTTTEFPPILIDHALHVTKFDRETLPETVIENGDLLDKLLLSLQEAQNVIREITSKDTAHGFILAKRSKSSTARTTGPNDDDRPSGLLYDDFHPFKPAQFAGDDSIEFVEIEGFNKTADEFFSSIEGQKLESKLQEREENARRKIDHARKEQQQRIGGLQQVQETNIRKAQAIEANVERVEEAVAAVNGLIGQGMDWEDIGHLIENEKVRSNPVAEMIKLPLKLQENTITVLLPEFDDVAEDPLADETDSDISDSDDDTARVIDRPKTTDTRLAVDIDLAASAWSNAREYYDQKRNAAVKQEKTLQASEKALKSTERKVLADLQKGLKTEKDILRPVRKQLWFEKFVYFISSDGYLVLAGKDAQQNEILYKRYLKKGDIYLHADLHGAASVIIKNNPSTPDAPIPPSTLGQAGNLAVCTSSAWDSKAGMSAWWVNADQVSKTAPTGEYLTTGSFMIKGRKNFLPPAQLLLGFAIVFSISEESKARHVKHRLRDEPNPPPSAGEAAESVGDDDDDDDDADDDFPDATPASGHAPRDRPVNGSDDDDDDDFPDAHGPVSIEQDTRRTVEREADQDEDQDEEEDEDDRDSPRANPLQHRGVGKPKDDEDQEDDDDEQSDDDQPDKSEGETATQSTEHGTSGSNKTSGDNAKAKSSTQSKPKVRGKRGKAKKAARKYAEQDEEDREAAMQLLGSRAEAKKEAEAAAKAAKQETQEEARIRRRAQHERQQKAGLEAEEIRRLNLEEGIENMDEEEAANLTQLDALVGTPLAGDEILDAIPICAPWSALTKYKYKVKLQPGQQKKGKAVREIVGRWTKDASDAKKIDSSSHDSERIWPREAELIKGLKEAEVVGIIPVKSVRVMMSGGAGGSDNKAKGGKGGKGGGRGGRGSKKNK